MHLEHFFSLECSLQGFQSEMGGNSAGTNNAYETMVKPSLYEEPAVCRERSVSTVSALFTYLRVGAIQYA